MALRLRVWRCQDCASQVIACRRHAVLRLLAKGARSRGYKARVKTTHGHTAGANSRTYRIWTNMRSRCTNPNFDSFRFYGGRGIRVCERWNNFAAFLADMGSAPDGKSLDRIDHNGDYEPGNCRWATQMEQCNNTRRNRILVWRGQSYTQAQLAREVGLDQRLIHDRLKRGWSVDRAVQQIAVTVRASGSASAE